MTVLQAVKFPAEWNRVRFGAVAHRVAEPGFGELAPLSVFLGDGVVPRSSRDDNHNQLGADLEKYQRVLPGDLVFNKLRTWQGGFGVSAHTGIVSPAYIVARPTRDIHPRYLHHLMLSEPVLAELRRLSKWMPPSQFDIGWEDIRGIELALPPLEEQRRIADFLDDQVATITTVVSLREQQLALLDASARATLDSSLEPWRHSAPPLRYMTAKIGSGKTPSGGADVYLDHGVAFLRSQNVHNDGLRLHDVAHIDTSTDEEMSATRVQVGDVLLNITGASIGRACWVPSGLGPANVNQHVCIVRPLERISSTLLAWALTGGYVQDQIQLSQVGGNRDGLNFEQVAALRIPIPLEQAEQARLADGLGERMQHLQETKKSLAAAIDALNEYKRSLITAAVTGELDVTTARQEMRV